MEFQLSYLKCYKIMLLKYCTQYSSKFWKSQQWPRDWKRSVVIPVPKKSSAKECSNYWTTVLISHASKVMVKILQARLQWYVNWELPDVQVGFRRQRNQRSNCQHPLNHRKSKRIPENIYFCFIDKAKAFDCVDHKKLWKIPRDGNTRPPYLSPEKPVCWSRSNS